MMHTCPNHELSREMIIQNFYAGLSHDDKTMLDTSYVGSFMKRTIEFKWDIIEGIELLNSNGILLKELISTLKIGKLTKVMSQV